MSDDAESFLGVKSQRDAPTPVATTTADTSNPTAGTGSMFRREDYWPYMFGIFVFAGLVAVPIIWGQFIDLPYGRLVAGSLVGCFVFAYAHKRDGQFSFGRFIIGFGFVFLMSMRFSVQSGGIGGFIPGGVLGFLVMGGGGWLGIGIARVTGIAKALKTP
jgi:MFS family permease